MEQLSRPGSGNVMTTLQWWLRSGPLPPNLTLCCSRTDHHPCHCSLWSGMQCPGCQMVRIIINSGTILIFVIGEGTRPEIVELLRDSQWLVPDTDTASLTVVVSGTLDRLQNEPDAPVRYDSNRKIWIYLHRAMSLEQLNSMPCDGPKQQRQRQKRKFKIDTTLPQSEQSNSDQSSSVQKIIVKDSDGNVIPLSQETLQHLINSGALKATP